MTAAPPHDLLFWAQPMAPGEAEQLAATAERLADQGWNVLLAWGSEHPPVVDGDFAVTMLIPSARWRADQPGMILDEDGIRAGHAWKKQRAASLLSLFARSRPAILLLDRFPFGNRAFRYELRPMLEMAYRRIPRPRIACLTADDGIAEPAMRELIDMVIGDAAELPPP
jgi:predicted glycosyltransferase